MDPTLTAEHIALMDDNTVLLLYRQWCEEIYAAGFIKPDEGHVRAFIEWLGQEWFPRSQEREDYEAEMLAVFRRLTSNT